MKESWKECFRLLGIRVSSLTRPQRLFLRASVTDLLEAYDKEWFLRHKERLRNELLMILEEFDPVTIEENQEPIPLHSKRDKIR